jgi:hypothetical protein
MRGILRPSTPGYPHSRLDWSPAAHLVLEELRLGLAPLELQPERDELLLLLVQLVALRGDAR